jgi:hypothetical protein
MESGPLSHQLGFDGFIWFIGVVESKDDPMLVGRCKVRIFGSHDKNTDSLSTDDLPYAYPLVPVTHAQLLPNYRIGDWVMGFFLDSRLGQHPIIFGVLPAVVQNQTNS